MNDKDNAAKAKAVDSLLNFETVSLKCGFNLFITYIYTDKSFVSFKTNILYTNRLM